MAISLLRQREIEQISSRAVMQKRAHRIFLNEDVIKRNTELVEGKRYYTFPIINMQGRAAIIANNSFDVGGVDAFVSERTQKIELLYQPWHLTFTDELEANASGAPIRSVAIEVATQSVYNSLDELGYTGVPSLGMYGIANQPNVAAYTLPPDGTGASTTFASKDADKILRDLNAIVYYASKLTKHAYNTTKLLVPPSVHEAMTQKYLGNPTNGGVYETALTRFLVSQEYSASGGITKDDIIIAPQLETAGPGGTPIIVAYNPDPEYIEYLRTPLSQRPLFETVEGVKSAMYCYAGATLLKQPLSCVIVPGA